VVESQATQHVSNYDSRHLIASRMDLSCYVNITPTWEDPGQAWKVAEKIGSSTSGGQFKRMEAVGSSRASLTDFRIRCKGILILDNNFG
jgi:hypothetical protein